MRRTAIAVFVTAAVVTTGCSGEDLAERVIEDRIEAESGEDVDIDFDDGGLSVQSEDGEFTIEVDDGNVSVSGAGEDGDFSMESQDGETIIESEDGSMVMSSSGDVPEGFPGVVPLPDGLTIQLSQSSDTPDGQIFSVTGEVPGEPSEVADDYVASLEAAGFDQAQLTTTPDGGFFVYQNDEFDVAGTVGAGGVGGTSFMTISVSPLSSG